MVPRLCILIVMLGELYAGGIMYRHRYFLWFVVFFLSFGLFAEIWHGKDTEFLAAIKQPVVDLYLKLPLQENSPASPAGYGDGSCKRAHQGLAHEVVTIVATDGYYVQVAFNNVIYGYDEQTKLPLSTFWTTKDHLIFFKSLTEQALSVFPGPRENKGDIVVLILPWKHYSLGTRFVRNPNKDTDDAYGIQLFSSSGRIIKRNIPRKYACVEEELNPKQARRHFVNLANTIVDHASRSSVDQIIMYVWGGSSYVHEYQDDKFVMKEKDGWRRPGKHNPYTGYDCSELVLRLAQISGIPYKNKTTIMLCQHAQELEPDDVLEEGDLIWFPGHVMIVSNIARNEIIEARGYGAGYGKVQRISLASCFANIDNYEQLREACAGKQPLQLRKKDGSVLQEIKDFKIFKLIANH